jgi:hypothetical protein
MRGRWHGFEKTKVDKDGYFEMGDRKPAVSKMGNVVSYVDGIRYASKAEGRYAEQLNLLWKAGAISFYLRQVGFDLPGGVRHFVDFLIFAPGCEMKFVEVKGRDLPLGRLKRRQVEELYGIHIEVVK